MAAPESMSARRAALLLHGLPGDARGRVLARLSALESAQLQPLLHELSELGVSASLCRGLHESATSAVVAPGTPASSARQRAEELSAAEVGRILNICSPVTMAAVLRMAEWPWKAEVLERAGELRRAELRPYLRGDSPELAPAVAEALCERMCREIEGGGDKSWTL
jgi:hypothetical protein